MNNVINRLTELVYLVILFGLTWLALIIFV